MIDFEKSLIKTSLDTRKGHDLIAFCFFVPILCWSELSFVCTLKRVAFNYSLFPQNVFCFTIGTLIYQYCLVQIKHVLNSEGYKSFNITSNDISVPDVA